MRQQSHHGHMPDRMNDWSTLRLLMCCGRGLCSLLRFCCWGLLPARADLLQRLTTAALIVAVAAI
jgi:hypothetical protein